MSDPVNERVEALYDEYLELFREAEDINDIKCADSSDFSHTKAWVAAKATVQLERAEARKSKFRYNVNIYLGSTALTHAVDGLQVDKIKSQLNAGEGVSFATIDDVCVAIPKQSSFVITFALCEKEDAL